MEEINVAVNKGKGPNTTCLGHVAYNMPSDLEEAVHMWGEKAVFEKLTKVVMQEIRTIASRAASIEGAQGVLNDWIPGQRRRGKIDGHGTDKVMEAIMQLPQERRQLWLRELGLE